MSLPTSERIASIRAKLARGEALDPAEELDWMDANMQPHEAPGELRPMEKAIQQLDDEGYYDKVGPKVKIVYADDDEDEDVEHHDVGLRRNALNILYIHRGDMFGTAIPLGNDMNETMKQIQLMVAEVYAARRQENHGA